MTDQYIVTFTIEVQAENHDDAEMEALHNISEVELKSVRRIGRRKNDT